MASSREEIHTSTPSIEIGSATHVGRVRGNNEDNYRVVPALNLYVLSDGIGGQASGEVASAMAVETIVTHCMDSSTDRPPYKREELQSGISDRTNELARAAYLANRAIYQTSVRDPQLEGMGATVVAARIDGHRLSLVHVGDSRAYLLRESLLERLTSDHTLVAEQVRRGLITLEQAQTNPLRRILIRSLGVHEEVEIDICEHELRAGDALLLCSDGLTGMVPESEITDVLLRGVDAQSAADRLVASANEHGGDDNVTVILARFGVSAGQRDCSAAL
jgi:serine/threonine protein phosphatase PrpC